MKKTAIFIAAAMVVFSVWGGCTNRETPPINSASVEPGSAVMRGDKKLPLLGAPISVGKTLPSVQLVDAMTMNNVDLSGEKGKVLFLSIVPSVDTKVCEAQTHYLGEEGDDLAGK